MKNVTWLIILFLLTWMTPLLADENSNEEVLKSLDQLIDNKSTYHVQKEKEILDLKQRLHRAKDNREKYERCGSLFNAYLHYQADSALYYIHGKMNLLPLLNHPELKNEIVINRAEVMGVMGMYNEDEVTMRAFGKHLALMGVKKRRTHYGDQYLLNRL